MHPKARGKTLGVFARNQEDYSCFVQATWLESLLHTRQIQSTQPNKRTEYNLLTFNDAQRMYKIHQSKDPVFALFLNHCGHSHNEGWSEDEAKEWTFPTKEMKAWETYLTPLPQFLCPDPCQSPGKKQIELVKLQYEAGQMQCRLPQNISSCNTDSRQKNGRAQSNCKMMQIRLNMTKYCEMMSSDARSTNDANYIP